MRKPNVTICLTQDSVDKIEKKKAEINRPQSYIVEQLIQKYISEIE